MFVMLMPGVVKHTACAKPNGNGNFYNVKKALRYFNMAKIFTIFIVMHLVPFSKGIKHVRCFYFKINRGFYVKSNQLILNQACI